MRSERYYHRAGGGMRVLVELVKGDDGCGVMKVV